MFMGEHTPHYWC